jgi:hypothetical protein
LPAYRIARLELSSRPAPSAVLPLLTTAATSPPWAPTPGTRKGMSPNERAHARQLLRPGRAGHQQAVAVAVPVARDRLRHALVQRHAAAVQVLEILRARVGGAAQQHHALVGAVEEGLHRVAAEVGIERDRVGAVAIEGSAA